MAEMSPLRRRMIEDMTVREISVTLHKKSLAISTSTPTPPPPTHAPPASDPPSLITTPRSGIAPATAGRTGRGFRRLVRPPPTVNPRAKCDSSESKGEEGNSMKITPSPDRPAPSWVSVTVSHRNLCFPSYQKYIDPYHINISDLPHGAANYESEGRCGEGFIVASIAKTGMNGSSPTPRKAASS